MPPNFVSLGARTWIGVDFTINVPGRMFGARVYCFAGDGGGHIAMLLDNTGKPLAVQHFWVSPLPVGWLQLWFRPVIRYSTTITYRLYVLMSNGYQRSTSGLASPPVTSNNVSLYRGVQTTSIYPPSVSPTTNTNANGVDILYIPDGV